MCQVLERQAQASRAGRAKHQPVRAFRKELVREGRAEDLVVGAEVVDVDARLRDARRSAGLEHVHGPAGKPFGNPALHGAAAQRLVLELPESREVREARDLAARIPAGFLRELEPVRTTGGRIEVPGDDLKHPRIESGSRMSARQ